MTILLGKDDEYWIPAAPWARHARELVDQSGLHWRVVAAHAGIAPRALESLLFGRRRGSSGRRRPARRIHVDIARTLLRICLDDLRTAETDLDNSAGAEVQLQQLFTAGWGPDELAPWLTRRDIATLTSSATVFCSRATAARVQACHDWILSSTPPDRRRLRSDASLERPLPFDLYAAA